VLELTQIFNTHNGKLATGMLDVGYSVRSGVNADLLLYR